MKALAQRDEQDVTSVVTRAPAKRSPLACDVCGGPKELGDARCDGCRGIHMTHEQFLSPITSYLDDARCRHLVRHFGDGLALEDIGELLGLTRERVRQIEHSAMRHFVARAKLAGISGEDLASVMQRTRPGEHVMPAGDDFQERPNMQGRVARIFTPESLVESDYTRTLNETLDEAHAVGLLACHAANLSEYG